MNPYALCDKAERFTGKIALADFPRLLPLLMDDKGVVQYSLTFARDAQARCYIDSRIKTTLRLQCQRCLHTMHHPVDAHTRLCAVTGIQEAQQLPDQYEPLLLTGEQVSLPDLVEDELILCVPDVPRHTGADCRVDVSRFNAHALTQQDALAYEKPNPFAVLAELKPDT